MTKETTDYSKFTLDPVKDVYVKPQILVELQQFTQRVKQEHTSFSFPQQTAWFHRETHKPLSNKSKISDEKRNKEYYANINLETTEKKGEVIYDDIGLSAIKLQAAFEEIFRYNVDNGNALPREESLPT